MIVLVPAPSPCPFHPGPSVHWVPEYYCTSTSGAAATETTVLKAATMKERTLHAIFFMRGRTTTVSDKFPEEARPIVKNGVRAFENPERLAATAAASDASPAVRQSTVRQSFTVPDVRHDH